MGHVSTMTELGKSENPWNRDDWKRTLARDTYWSFGIELANSEEALYHDYIFEQTFPIRITSIYFFRKKYRNGLNSIPVKFVIKKKKRNVIFRTIEIEICSYVNEDDIPMFIPSLNERERQCKVWRNLQWKL